MAGVDWAEKGGAPEWGTQPGAESWVAPAAEAPLRPGGFWRRGVALGLDLVIVAVLLGGGSVIATTLARRDLVALAFTYAFRLVIPAAYFILSHGTGGRTLGKRLLGVRVVGLAGEPIGYPRALARLAAMLLSVLPFGFGFVLAVTQPDKRALHDLLAATRVVRARGPN